MRDDVVLAAAEQAKYERVWTHEAYRRISPGEMEVDAAWLMLGMRTGDRLLDLGAGPGRATRAFRARGVDAVAVDFAENALEAEGVPFVAACLWDLPRDLPPADWGFCCDVMEHIPPEMVERTLAAIAGKVTRGAWFRIATRPDVMGPRLIGAPLHLSVHDADWWQRRLGGHFENVRRVRHDARDAVFATGRGAVQPGWMA